MILIWLHLLEPARLFIYQMVLLIMPIAGVRVGLIDDQFVINPTNPQQIQSKLELVVAGTESAIVMVECSAHEIPEERMIEAIEFAHEQIKKIIAGITRAV